MTRKKSIVLMNMNIDDAKLNNFNYVAVPVYEEGLEQMRKIKGQYEAKLHQYRNLRFHRKLFTMARFCVSQGILDRLADKWEDVRLTFNIEFIIDSFAMQLIRMKYKNDAYSLIYICKWLFLPLEEIIKPNGEKSHEITSISFEEMDNVVFEEFYNNCLEFFSFVMDVNRRVLEGNN